MNIHSVHEFFHRRFRPRRAAQFREMFPEIDQPIRILDVGGSPGWWNDLAPKSASVTIVNTDERLRALTERSGYGFLPADGRSLPFPDRHFDVVFSNSVIEHVGCLDDQRRFAAELRRCGKSLYLQTPNRWFFVEPHLITAFLHWLPATAQAPLVRWTSVWGWVTRPSRAEARSFLAGTRLLSRGEVLELFPDCTIREERLAGMAKSFIVTRHP